MTTKHHDDFGDRMKAYERAFTNHHVNVFLPIYARLDGRSFSKFTKKMVRPFDSDMSQTMVDVTEHLVKETKADIGYTQSDEISLIWYPSDNPFSQFMFDGKIQKLASVLASMCAAKFMLSYRKHFEKDPEIIPSFDCRILDLPSITEANNMLLWRIKDAFKNSVQSTAHEIFGHKALMNVDTKGKLDMLKEKGIDFFKEYPVSFRVGTMIKPETVVKMLSDEELENIPEKHRPTGPVTRTIYTKSYPEHVQNKYLD